MRVLPSAAAAAVLLMTGSGLFGADWSYDSNSGPSMGEKASGAAVQAGAPMTSQAELAQQVAAVEYAQVDAWNKHDLQSYLQWYWNSPELISLSNGDEIVGFAALANELRTGYGSDPNSMGHVQMERLRVKMTGSDSAVMVASYVITTSKHSDLFEDTTVLKRFSEGWRIVFESANLHAQ
jgi:hypothetical protein